MNMRTRTIVLYTTLTVAVVGAGGLAYGAIDSSGSSPNQTATRLVSATVGTTPDPVAVGQAQAAVAAAQLAVTNAQKTLDATTLKAPQAGTISAVNYSVGQTVGGGGTSASSSSSSSGSSAGSGSGSSGS